MDELDPVTDLVLDLLGRIERIARVSDGYQSIARERELSLAARFDKQLRQLEKKIAVALKDKIL